MRIRALNEPDTSNSTSGESSTDDGRQQSLSKEAVEEQCFERYKEALVAIQESRESRARVLLESLNQELNDSKLEGDTFVQLRFSVLKNLGNICRDNIDHFIGALSIDPTDISLWVKAGDRSTNLKNYSFARQCFEQALVINPDNRVAIDRLMELYYILHLPLELYDICMRALNLNKRYKKAIILLEEAKKLQPSMKNSCDDTKLKNALSNGLDEGDIISPLLEVKKKRRCHLQNELQKFKRARLGITLDTARTQSLASFGNYIIKIYERFAKQCITRNSVIDITLNNTLSFTQQFTNGTHNGHFNHQNSNENQTSSQDVEMAIEGDGTSISDNDKSNNRNEANMSIDDNDQTKSNSNRSRSNQNIQKNSSLSFAAMLFPMDLGDKRRSSRNRSNQDDNFSFKMKFDELNDLIPECLRIGAIEQVLQAKREEQQRNSDAMEKEKQDEPVLVETNLDPVREDLIIKDIIEAISGTIQTSGPLIKNEIKLCDMFYLYLSKLSAKKQNVLPEAFAKIYKIYRKLCPLTNDIFIEIGPNGITLDELWFTLTANEITYQSQECAFLLRILDQLQIYMDESQHKEFLVRLFLVLGLNSDYRYLEVALQNIEEDTRVYASNRKTISRAYIKTLIDRENEKLQQATDDPDDSMELIERLAPKSENEMSDREIQSLCTAIKSTSSWQRGLDILNQRNDLNSDVIMDTINECLKHGAKMDAILASKLCKDAISNSRPSTWTCLYRGSISVLSEEDLANEEIISKFHKFFELGHQTLGKKCVCNSDRGEFLMLYVKQLLDEGSENFEERELLGALNCLFNYGKKPSSVASHKAQKVPILWEYAEVIYPYLEPEEQPTYMSLLRKAGITSEVEPIFKEIAMTAPSHLNPRKQVEIIENFIDRGEPIVGLSIQKNEVTKDIYYLLADYHFKNKDFSTAKQFYNYDLVINPDRFDSWAASALIRANGIDKALSEGTVTIEEYISGAFYSLVNSTIRCFEQATKLKPNELKATLWVEFGNLTYNLASLGQRLFDYLDCESEINGVEEEFPQIEPFNRRYEQLCILARDCFRSANKFCESEEVWLHYYMLGKIAEKLDTFDALDYYQKADAQLLREGASYPCKISYHNPPTLAYEAMEVHYRIHSASLKYLLNADDITQEHMNRLRRYLMNAQRSSFVELEGHPSPKQVPHRIQHDVRLVLEDLLEEICHDAEFDELIFICLQGMKRCLLRCDKNFKTLYRLAFYYEKIQDPSMAQDILIARELKTDQRIKNLITRKPGVPEFRAAPPDLKGIDSLFKDRKMGNLFFNIWRIPVEEVDRPGSFEHWMFKCTRLLIRTCVDLNDTNMLTIIAFQLSRQPETSKKYLQNKPRVLLAQYAVNTIIQIVLSAIENAINPETKRNFIREGIALADKFIKANVFADKMRHLFNRLQASLL